jgi:glutamine cyclotransferase
MKRSAAEILREYGPFAGIEGVHGVTFDGHHVWFASGDKLNALDPSSGKTLRSIDVAAHAGTAFDGEHLFQIADDRIQKIDPKTGRVLATIPAPGAAATLASRGPKEPFGWGSIRTGRSTKSIPKQARFFVP